MHCLRRMIQHQSTNSVFEHNIVKVYQQPDCAARKPKIRQQNSLVYRSKRFDRLYLENNLPTNEEIDSVAAIEFDVFVYKCNGLLSLERDLSDHKFPS